MQPTHVGNSAPDLPTLQPRTPNCPVPLTATQRRLWNHIHKEQGGLNRRMIPIQTRLLGPLDVDMLRRSLEAVMQRHESLRTKIEVNEGIPTQRIDPAPDCHWELLDLSTHELTEAATEVDLITTALAEEDIDLTVGPLLSATLCKLADEEHVLIIAIDHMITDMLSNVILLRELLSCYHQFARGSHPTLPPMRLQFADYAAWQHRTNDAWQQKHGEYWRRRLAGAQPVKFPLKKTQLTDAARPEYAMLYVRFGTALTNALRDVARLEKTSLPMIVLVAYVAAISRWCDQRDFLIAFLTHSRFHPDLVSMIGFLVSKLHLRVELTAEDTYMDLLKRIELELRCAYEHQDSNRLALTAQECAGALPFDWVPTTRSAKPANVHLAGTANPLRAEPFSSDIVIPNPIALSHPLFFLFSDTNTGVVATARYQPDLFEEGSIERLCSNMKSFAEKLALQPHAGIHSDDHLAKNPE